MSRATEPVPTAVVVDLADPVRAPAAADGIRDRAGVRQVLRVKIVLAAVGGPADAVIARELKISVNTVRKWRCRFAADGPTGPLPALRSSPLSKPSTAASGCGGIQSGATSPRWRSGSDMSKNAPSQCKHRVFSIRGKLPSRRSPLREASGTLRIRRAPPPPPPTDTDKTDKADRRLSTNLIGSGRRGVARPSGWRNEYTSDRASVA
jgi:hypothetical protein